MYRKINFSILRLIADFPDNGALRGGEGSDAAGSLRPRREGRRHDAREKRKHPRLRLAVDALGRSAAAELGAHHGHAVALLERLRQPRIVRSVEQHALARGERTCDHGREDANRHLVNNRHRPALHD